MLAPGTLQPGVYCGGIRLGVGAVVTFAGENIIKDSPLTMLPNSAMIGQDVGFYLTGEDAVLDISSNREVTLSAPKTGPLAGMIFFQDRNFGGAHEFHSTSALTLDGIFYVPKATLFANSNVAIGSASVCLQIVAYRIHFDSFSGVNTTPDYTRCATPPNVRQTSVVG